jgi:hypothetical protein
MPPPPSVTQIRLDTITTTLAAAVATLELLSTCLNTPFLGAICNTMQALLKSAQVEILTVSQTTLYLIHTPDC